jgi:hypothetical protein
MPKPSQGGARLNYTAFRTAIADWLGTARKAAGVTPVQLAAATGVSDDRIRRIELGSVEIYSLWEIYSLCHELGPCAPPVPFEPEIRALPQLMRLARGLRPDEREALVVSCYSTVPGARIDLEYERAHDGWPLVVPDKLLAKLHARGLAWQLERYDAYPEETDVNRAVCVRTYTGNAVAEVLGREMF